VWNGKLVCDDFAGYKPGFELGITEIGCMAHARRKFFDLHVANKSQLAEQALHLIGGLCEVERQAKDMSNEERWRLRQEIAVPVAEKLHEWMLSGAAFPRDACSPKHCRDFKAPHSPVMESVRPHGATPYRLEIGSSITMIRSLFSLPPFSSSSPLQTLGSTERR